jgi:hypothetical protein
MPDEPDLAGGALSAGSVAATLAADIDDAGFIRFDRELDRIDKSGAKASLGAEVDERGFKAFDARMAKVDRSSATAEIKIDTDRGIFDRIQAGLTGTDRKVNTLNTSMGKTNRSFLFFRNLTSLLKWPALIVGAGGAAQAISALAGGALALTGALAPGVGLLTQYATGLGVLGQVFGSIKLASSGVGDALSAYTSQQEQAGTAASGMAEKVAGAAEQVRQAELGVAAAQRTEQIAQESLTRAREEATRQLEDMKDAAEDTRLTEQRAELSLRQARQALREGLRDPNTTRLELADLRLGVKEARDALEDTRREGERIREDARRAERLGIRRAPEVVAARRALADANRATAESERQLAQAQRDVGRAMSDGGSATDAFAAKMGQLSPAAQKFVRTLIGLQPRIDELKASTAENLFPGVERGIDAAMENFGPFQRVLNGTSRTLGNLAERAGEFVGSKGFGRDFEKIGNTNNRVLDRMGRSGINLAAALTDIMVAARPLTNWVSKSILGWTQHTRAQAQAGRESGKLTEFFESTREVTEKVFSILGHVGHALWNIIKLGKPLGDEILDRLDEGAENLERWTESTRGKNSIREYFRDIRGPLFEAGRLLRDMLGVFLRLGTQPGLEKLLHNLRVRLLPVFEEVVGSTTEAFGPRLIDLLTELLLLLGKLAGASGPLTLWVDGMTMAAKFLNKLFDTVPGLRSLTVTMIGFAAVLKALSFAAAITGLSRLIGLQRTLRGTTAASTTAMATQQAVAARGLVPGIGGRGRIGGPLAPSTVAQAPFGAPIGRGAGGLSRAGGIFGRVGVGVAGLLGGGPGVAAIASAAAPIAAIAGGMKLIDETGLLDAGGPVSKTPLGSILGIGSRSLESQGRAFVGVAEAMDRLDRSASIKNVKGAVKALEAAEEQGVDTGDSLDELRNSMAHLSTRVLGGEKVLKSMNRVLKGLSTMEPQEAIAGLRDKYGGLVSAGHEMGKKQREVFINMMRVARENGDITQNQLARVTDAFGDNTRKWETMMRRAAKETGQSTRGMKRSVGDMTVTVAKDYQGLVRVVGGGLDWLTSNTSKAAQNLGVKREIKWHTSDQRLPGMSRAETSAHRHHLNPQRGGVISGVGVGDHVPLGAELGSYFVNKRAAEVFRPILARLTGGSGPRSTATTNVLAEPGEHYVDAATTQRNFALLEWMNNVVPRFQTGGIYAGMGPGITRLMRTVIGRFGGAMSSGLRRGDDGLHGQGLAGDWVGGDWAGAARYMNQIGSQLAEGIYTGAHGGPPVSWDEGRRVSPDFWGEDWAPHSTHIHMAIRGMVGRLVERIKRVILHGSPGSMRDAGQGSLDTVWKAANRFLRRESRVGPELGATAGALSKRQLATLWSATGGGGNASLMAAIALAESGGVPTAHGPPDGRGLWQIEWPIWRGQLGQFGNPYNARANARMAHEVLDQQGLSAWVVYNTGAYRQHLQRGGEAGPGGPGGRGWGWDPRQTRRDWRKRFRGIPDVFEELFEAIGAGDRDAAADPERWLINASSSRTIRRARRIEREAIGNLGHEMRVTRRGRRERLDEIANPVLKARAFLRAAQRRHRRDPHETPGSEVQAARHALRRARSTFRERRHDVRHTFRRRLRDLGERREDWRGATDRRLNRVLGRGFGELGNFQAARADLFGTFGSNFEGPRGPARRFGPAFFGATGSAVARPVIAAGGNPYGGTRVIEGDVVLNNYFREGPREPHVWARSSMFELRSAA